MLRSFYIALSGLNSSKDWLDITSNNVANANTIGFKKARPVFQNLVLQNVAHYNSISGSVSNVSYGGGVITAMTQTIFSMGPFKNTGLNTDVAIEGDGFLVLQDSNGKDYYTRDGELKLATKEENGVQYTYLIHNSGLNVMAYDISQLSSGATASPSLTPVKFKVEIPPKATQEIYSQDGSNLDPRAEIITSTFNPTDSTTFDSTYTLQVYDDQGNSYDAGIFFVKLPEVEVSDGTNNYYVYIDDNGDLYYNDNGNTYYVDKGDSVSPDSNDEIITLRNNIVAASGNYDLVYDKTQGTYYLKDSSGNYYTLTTSATSVTPSGNTLRLDNLWQVYTLKNDGNTWVDLSKDGLTDNSSYKFNIVAFNEDGSLAGVTSTTDWTPSNLSSQTEIALQDPQGVLKVSDWNLKGLTSYPTDFSLGFSQDGYPPGRLENISIGDDGTITAIYSNGQNLNLYRLCLAYFGDKQDLHSIGSNLFESLRENPLLEYAGVRSEIRSGTLEMSNVDIAEELVNMITAEKSYQANAKVIQTGETILDTAINLKR